MQRRILLAVDPMKASLSTAAVRGVALGAVAQWASDQDESVAADRVLDVVRHAVAWVHEQFA